jgi:pSer/pThr/pTyr-binding forkhead associated (FHA) protein
VTALIVDTGSESFAFTETFTVGRKGADLIIDDEYASPLHARFSCPGAWFAEDLGSTNGTYLNG